MKQRLLLFLASLMVLLPVFAEDTGMLTFWPNGRNQVTITEVGNGEYMVVVNGLDPYARLSRLTSDLTDEQNTVKFEYKLNKDLGAGVEFFFSPEQGGREQTFSLLPTDEWTLAQVNIEGSRKAFGWGKVDDYLRFDFGSATSVAAGAVLQLRNIRIGAPETPVLDDLEQDEDGVCLLSTAEDLEKYAGYVNKGLPLDAKLKNDIDYRGHSKFMGTEACHYGNTFDGQGHTITLGFEPTAEKQALFSQFEGNIKNLVVKGDINTSKVRTAGLVAYSYGGYIDNCVSLVNINSTAEGDAVYGGLVSEHHDGYLYITNCLYAGKITSPKAYDTGGLMGWSQGQSIFKNCVMAGDIAETTGSDCHMIVRNPGNASIISCVYVRDIDNVKNDAGGKLTPIAANGLASGELACKANAVIGSIVYRQNIGEDAVPVPFASHKQVYAQGNLRCDGMPLDENVTYSNTESALPSHTYVDGVCTTCGHADMNFVPQLDGVYQVANGAQLHWISKYVAMGNSVDFVLTADIDMTGIDFDPIGSSDKKFTGKFDGQGHRILNLTVNRPEQEGVGLFGVVTGSVEVKNVILDKTCSITGKCFSGVVGRSLGGTNLLMECVGNEGSTTVSAQNGSGMYGCNYGQSALVTLRNCYVTGSVKAGNEAGALSGWAYHASIDGCWSTAEVTGADNAGTSMFRGEAYPSANNYSTHGQCTAITLDDVASGKLTYMLNGGLKVSPVWYQTLNVDEKPVFDSTHGIVYKVGEEYGDIHDEATLSQFKDNALNEARNYAQDLVASVGLLEDYNVETDAMEGATTREDIIAHALLMQDVRKDLEASAQAYADFRQTVDETLEFIENNNYVGQERDDLEAYLTSTDEPNDLYMNGGAEYIYSTHELDTEDVRAEIDYINNLKQDMINNCYQSGADVTLLLTNPDFAQGFEGWSGESKLNGFIKSNTTGLYGAEYYGSGAFDMYQTVQDVKNGVYVLAANAAVRPFNEVDAQYYNAELYLNANSVFVPTVYESRISPEDAQDGVNCYLTATNAADACPDMEIKDAAGNLIGYGIHGRTSMANAASAGRAQNYMLAEVTDGTLTVGYRKPASTSGNEWAGLSNIHLYYFASMEDAAKYLDSTLACQAARATNVANLQHDAVDYVKKPNCPQAIKDALVQAAADVQTAETSAQKYALVQKFVTLFSQFQEGRSAYVNMAKEADFVDKVTSTLTAAGKMDEAEADKVADAVAQTWEAYNAGSYSAQEAQALATLKATGILPEVEDGVCQIENNLHMAYFAAKVNDGVAINGKLLADIDYFTKEQIMGTFRGTFDGDYHTITVDINTDANNAAIFANSDNATVKNLVVRGNIVTSAQFAAAVVGITAGGVTNISNVESYVHIVSSRAGANGGSADGTDGGIVGCANAEVNISNSLFAGSIKGATTNCCGGLVGWASAMARINNSLVAATFDLDPSGCNTISRGPGLSASNCYYLNALGDVPGGATAVTADQLKSGEVCYLLNGELDVNPIWRQTLGVDANPVLNPTHLVVGKREDGTFANDASSEMAKHNGTEDDPYPLSCLADLQVMRKCMTPGKTTYFVLANDIDMAGVKNWENLNVYGDEADGKHYANFINLDGKGHVIKNFKCSDSEYPSFFGVLCGEVRNLGFENASVTSGTKGTGILGGYVGHGSYADAEGKPRATVLENVWVTGDITCAAERCGALAGTIGGPVTIKNCYVNVNMTANLDQVGAIAGRMKAPVTVNNFYAAGSVPAGKGLVGINQSATASSYTNVAVWNNTEKVFGALGASDTTDGIIYYDGDNFAAMQQAVVAWDAEVWYCTMDEGAYPVLKKFLPTAIEGVGESRANTTSDAIYNLSGQRVQKAQKGIYIIGGRKVLVK